MSIVAMKNRRATAPEQVRLCIGTPDDWAELETGWCPEGAVTFRPYKALVLSPGVLRQTALVTARLFCAQYDAVDMAHLLAMAQYRGRLLLVSPDRLPRPQIVRDELHEIHPDLEIDFHFATGPRLKAV